MLNNVVQGSEEYWYDGDGRRSQVLARDAAGNRSGLTWFLGPTEAHYDAAGNVVHVYSHLSLGTPVARVDRTSNTTTKLELQFHGLANNTLAAIAEDGTINAAFSYAPFGEVIEASDAGSATGAGVAAHPRRFNDAYVDAVTGLAYYGYRYYDKTLIGWTQIDPDFRAAASKASTSPRRDNSYAFSLANPLRYRDPDGRSPEDVANGIHVPSQEEFARITGTYRTIIQNAAGKSEQTRIDAARAAVDLLKRSFNVREGRWEGRTRIVVERDLTRFGEHVAGRFSPTDDAIRLRLSDIEVTESDQIVLALLMLIHETTHSEQAAGYHAFSLEDVAYDAERTALLMLDGAGLVDNFDALWAIINGGEALWIAGSIGNGHCVPCERMPSMHEVPDMFRQIFRKRTIPYVQGLWGIQVNPDGPLAPPPKPQ